MATPEVRAIYAAFDRHPVVGGMDEPCRRLLAGALEAAGVELGEFDTRILNWLTRWEPATIAVIAGWVQRAHAAGRQQAGPALDASQLAAVLDSEPWTCRDCGGQMIGQRTPDDLCPTCLGFRLSGDGR